MKIIIGGDFSPRNRLEQVIRDNNYKDSLLELKDLFSNYDYSIVNFETTIETPGAKPINKVGPNLKSSPNTIDALKWMGVNVVTMANNHVYDYGELAMNNAVDSLNKVGIQSVGIGKDLEESRKPLYLTKGNETLAIINCCEYEYGIARDKISGANPLNPVTIFYDIKEAKKNANYVVVITHGGHEQFPLPSLRMVDTYRFFIDAGADAVINHHQHCFSGFEIYNGKTIFYGLGNLAFDFISDKYPFGWTQGILVELSLNKGQIDYKILPYNQFNKEAKVSLIKDSEDILGKISELSKIISNRALLSDKVSDYYLKSQKQTEARLQPFSWKILRALYSRGILPSCISKRSLMLLRNTVLCEAHRDKLNFFLLNHDGNTKQGNTCH